MRPRAIRLTCPTCRANPILPAWAVRLLFHRPQDRMLAMWDCPAPCGQPNTTQIPKAYWARVVDVVGWVYRYEPPAEALEAHPTTPMTDADADMFVDLLESTDTIVGLLG